MLRENDQLDAQFLSLIYFNSTILYMFWTNNCSKDIEDSLTGINYWEKVCISLVILKYRVYASRCTVQWM